MQDTISELVKTLTANHEDAFRYFSLTEGYEVTLNQIEAGAHVPPHQHEQDVFNYVFEGEFEVQLNEEIKLLRKGDWIQIPAHHSHSVRTHSKTTLLELWRLRS